MVERFVTIEECEKSIGELETQLAVWQGLKYIIAQGYFLMYNELTEKYRTIQPGRPAGMT